MTNVCSLDQTRENTPQNKARRFSPGPRCMSETFLKLFKVLLFRTTAHTVTARELNTELVIATAPYGNHRAHTSYIFTSKYSHKPKQLLALQRPARTSSSAGAYPGCLHGLEKLQWALAPRCRYQRRLQAAGCRRRARPILRTSLNTAM